MSFVVPEGDGVRLLSLDGGDARCVSQLVILDELMSRLKHDLGRDVRPCEYFHSITGVGAGGVIAILLGVLGLSIEKATEAFGQLCEQVFPASGCTDEERSLRLLNATKHILDDLQIPEGAHLQGSLDISAGCRVSVCYLTSVTESCRMLRSYESRHSSYNPTIIEAVRACWATPGLFYPIRIGKFPVQEIAISAVNGFNNPTLEAITEAREVFGNNRVISSVLSLGSGKGSAVPAISVDVAFRVAQQTEVTADNLQRRFGKLDIYFRFSVDRGIEIEYTDLEGHFSSITSRTQGYLGGDTVSNSVDRYLKLSTRRSRVSLDKLYRTKLGALKSSHGLPPLSPCFIMREGPVNEINVALERRVPGSPTIGVITCMSGTGKTQISLKYAYDNSDDSTESIEKSLVSRIRSIDRQLHPKTGEEAVELLISPEGELGDNWLVIMDNADDRKVELRNYIPHCDHGSILITSRNASLGDLFPAGHIPLDVMSREEAVEALLSAALGPKETSFDGIFEGRPVASARTEQDYECAGSIVEELGRLPLAVIQAACYIKRQKCLHEYLYLLRNSRSKILRWPASVQRDRLQYAHSTYAAFDTTLSALSPRALNLLGIISFVHFSDFPRALFALAASRDFAYQPYDLLDRTPEYYQSIETLRQIFCPNGHWDQMELDGLLEELHSYSLVTLVTVFAVVTLRFHPLLHGWANDRLSPSERTLFQMAAIRMLVCGTHRDDIYLQIYLTPHINLLSLASAELHVNDKAALASILQYNEQYREYFAVWDSIYTVVGVAYGPRNIRTGRAALQLADAYADQGEWNKMELMEHEILQMWKEDLGDNHLDTALAMANLARTFRWGDPPRYQEAAQLELKVLRIRQQLLGPKHREIVDALSDLAATYAEQRNFQEAQSLLIQAWDMITALVGEAHVASIRIMEQRVDCHQKGGDVLEGIRLTREATELWRIVYGERHVGTLHAMAYLAQSYSQQGHYQESEKLWHEVVSARRDILGERHIATLDAIFGLGVSIYQQLRWKDAESVFRQGAAGRRYTLGNTHHDTLHGLCWLGVSLYEQGWFAEAEELFKEVASARRSNLGDTQKDTLDALYWLGRCVSNQNRPVEAEGIFRDVVSGFRAALGHTHRDTLGTVYWLASSLYGQGRPAEAEVLLRQVIASSQNIGGDRYGKNYAASLLLAVSVCEQRRFLDAEVMLQELVGDTRARFGDEHTYTLSAHDALVKTRRLMVEQAAM